MAGDSLNYGQLMARALRTVMAEALGEVAENGLPGDHYFYITFQTDHPGVDMPRWLRERYPQEMVIILQEWFQDLAVMDDRFRVTLSFSDRPETLVIPFVAVKSFIDPGAKFGLKFDDHESDEVLLDVEDIEASTAGPSPAGNEQAAEGEGAGDEGDADKSSADVVSLDRFRKP